MGICGSSIPTEINPDMIDMSHFEMLKVVGKGGFGKVNAVQRRTNNQLFAVKRLQKCVVIKKESHIKMVSYVSIIFSLNNM